MAETKCLRLDKSFLSHPALTEALSQPDGCRHILIYCSLLANIGETVPCDRQALATAIGVDPEELQAALNALYRLKLISLSEKSPSEPPSLQEIEAYCRELGSSVDPVRFYDYYAADGFRYQGKPMDWKAKLRQWNVRQRPQRSANPFLNMLKEEALEQH